jgi:hypothetical protein
MCIIRIPTYVGAMYTSDSHIIQSAAMLLSDTVLQRLGKSSPPFTMSNLFFAASLLNKFDTALPSYMPTPYQHHSNVHMSYGCYTPNSGAAATLPASGQSRGPDRSESPLETKTNKNDFPIRLPLINNMRRSIPIDTPYHCA